MKNNFKKIALALATLYATSGSAQLPTLEWNANGSSQTTLGPVTTAINVDFFRNLQNPAPGGTFTSDGTPLMATVSFRNQQRSTTLTGTSTVIQGMTFGGRNTDDNSNSTGTDDPAGTAGVQAIGSAYVYNVFAADIPASKPLNNMYVSSPAAAAVSQTSTTSGGSGTLGGFDTQIITGQTGPDGTDGNFGLALYTAAEPLADIGANPAGRFYYGDIVISFNRTVKDPVVHVGGLGGSYSYLTIGGTTLNAFFTTELELVNATNNGASVLLAGNLNISVVDNKILNTNASPNAGSVLGDGTYGAASGSVKVSGNYSQLVYRVYLKGTPGNFGWSQTANNITSANRDPFNGDLWYLSISTVVPTQQVSGNVFYDEDFTSGNIWNNVNNLTTYQRTDGSQNGSTINSAAPGIFFANLLDNNGNIIATQPIGRDGSYLFDNVAVGTYTVSLTRDPGYVGALSPDGYPFNWRNTGELIGLGSGNDGTINGRSIPFTIGSGQVQTNVNFGVFNLAALPVQLISFNGALNGSTAKLNWVVTNEISFANYQLERSLNGVDYNNIANVAPIGTGAGQQTYTQNDNVAGLNGKIYYRLKMINRDGSFSYSNVVIVRIGGIKISNVYPNPFKDAIRIELESKTKENAQIRITDMSGKQVILTQEQIQIGGNQFTINGLSKLANGTYMVEITTSSEKLIEKLIKN